jgi:hypothetical protein
VSKKLIIITAASGLVSFAGAFVFGWLTKPQPRLVTDEPDQPKLESVETNPELIQPGIDVTSAVGMVSEKEKKALTEKQLKSLIFEVRDKMKEYNDRLEYIKVQEQRLQLAQDTLKKDIENLNNMRVELASVAANIKNEQDKLLKSRLNIAQTEKANLMLIAATYDKMDAASASKIVISMCTSQTQPEKIDKQGIGFDEAVKILYYMTDRTKAKLLGELTSTEPKLAASLTQRLKQIVEGS